MQSSEIQPEELDRALRRAIEETDAKAVESVLQKRASTNWAAPVVPKKGAAWLLSLVQLKEEKPLSVLHLAVRKRNLKIVQLLLEYRAKVDVVDEDGFTPIVVAAINGSWDIVKAMIYPGIYHPVRKRDKFQYDAALFYVVQAGNVELARQLIEAGAPTDYVDLEDSLSVRDFVGLEYSMTQLIDGGYDEAIKQKKAREKAALEKARQNSVTPFTTALQNHSPQTVLLGLLSMPGSLRALTADEDALKPVYDSLMDVLALPKKINPLHSLAKKVMRTTSSIPKSIRVIYKTPEEQKPTDAYVRVQVALKMKEHAKAESTLDKYIDRQLPRLVYALLLEHEAYNEPSKALTLLLRHGDYIAGGLKDEREFPHFLQHIETLINMKPFPEDVELQLDLKSVKATPASLKGKYALLDKLCGFASKEGTFYGRVQSIAKIYWQELYIETLLEILQGGECSLNQMKSFLDYFTSIVSPESPGLPEPLKKAITETPQDQKGLIVNGKDTVTLCKRLQHVLRDTEVSGKFGLFKLAVDGVINLSERQEQEQAEAQAVAPTVASEEEGGLDFSFLPGPK